MMKLRKTSGSVVTHENILLLKIAEILRIVYDYS